MVTQKKGISVQPKRTSKRKRERRRAIIIRTYENFAHILFTTYSSTDAAGPLNILQFVMCKKKRSIQKMANNSFLVIKCLLSL